MTVEGEGTTREFVPLVRQDEMLQMWMKVPGDTTDWAIHGSILFPVSLTHCRFWPSFLLSGRSSAHAFMGERPRTCRRRVEIQLLSTPACHDKIIIRS